MIKGTAFDVSHCMRSTGDKGLPLRRRIAAFALHARRVSRTVRGGQFPGMADKAEQGSTTRRAGMQRPRSAVHDVTERLPRFSMALMAGNLQHAFLLHLIVIEPRVLCFFRLQASLHFWILSRFSG